jgi:hypothetical protein
MSKEPDQPERKSKASKNGRGTSDEYKRFEDTMRRLVRVPKKDIDAAHEREVERKRA